MKRTLLFAAAAAAVLAGAPAIADERVPVIRDQIVKKECGDCHMAFQPIFLPASSWRKIMDGLSDHFGEDASLDDETKRHITDYLVAHAGRASRANVGIKISELRWFVGEHRGEVSPRSRKRAGTMSNCAACHRGADKGYYDDD